MIQWEMPSVNKPSPTRAKNCALNPGVLDPSGDQISHLAIMWVDDALIVAIGMLSIQMALAATIEAIYVVLGEPGLRYRQCEITMDNWFVEMKS